MQAYYLQSGRVTFNVTRHQPIGWDERLRMRPWIVRALDLGNKIASLIEQE